MATPNHPDDWRWQHRHAATCLDDIERLFPGRFDLTALDRPGIERATRLWGMRATPYYLDLARQASECDPVWCLAVPSPRETERLPEERDDPIGDERPDLHPHPAITRRYRDRVLLYPTPTCSVHCRHCFRRRMVGNPEYAVDQAGMDEALAWIGSEPDLHEVILTGGDPLTLADDRLLQLLERIEAIPHVWTLRLHTRMPVVNPFRITETLAQGLSRLHKPLTVVAHFNHPVEVTSAAAAAAGRLVDRGVAVLNQAVLLAGLNDDPDVHRQLIWSLLRARIRPYALHHADLVPGTGHLRTSVAVGRSLMAALCDTVPGYALPRYVRDLPGGHGKVAMETTPTDALASI